MGRQAIAQIDVQILLNRFTHRSILLQDSYIMSCSVFFPLKDSKIKGFHAITKKSYRNKSEHGNHLIAADNHLLGATKSIKIALGSRWQVTRKPNRKNLDSIGCPLLGASLIKQSSHKIYVALFYLKKSE
uniref:Uncharacterized protein n=1 Tax=Glossina pallidipes TaxID=7398 RepID=A0A1A9ZP46_GLOPL